MLLKLNDMIINTDHIIKADYNFKSAKASLILHMTDWGQRADPGARMVSHGSLVILNGTDAQLMWSALSQLATPVTPKPR